MKKLKIVFCVLLLFLLITGCVKDKENRDALQFKTEYESLNGKTNASGKVHREVSIPIDNPFVYITPEELIEKIEKKETFYVYFGSKLCPWCRSVIEKTIEVAHEMDIKTIYYIDIWDEEGNEILRDQYTLEEDVPTLVKEGTESYYKLLSLFDNVLSDYTLTNQDGNTYAVGGKRIYAPNFLYVDTGKALKITEATSSQQTDSREELTDEMLKEEVELLRKFFTTTICETEENC